MKSWNLWISILAAGILIGFLTGYVLDSIVWSISYDYVFAPAKFQEQGIQIGFLAAALIGFVSTFAENLSITRGQLILRCIVVQIGVLLITLLIAGIWAMLVKWNAINPIPDSITPKARIAFCFGLNYGAILATILSVIYFCKSLFNSVQPKEPIHG